MCARFFLISQQLSNLLLLFVCTDLVEVRRMDFEKKCQRTTYQLSKKRKPTPFLRGIASVHDRI